MSDEDFDPKFDERRAWWSIKSMEYTLRRSRKYMSPDQVREPEDNLKHAREYYDQGSKRERR